MSRLATHWQPSVQQAAVRAVVAEWMQCGRPSPSSEHEFHLLELHSTVRQWYHLILHDRHTIGSISRCNTIDSHTAAFRLCRATAFKADTLTPMFADTVNLASLLSTNVTRT